MAGLTKIGPSHDSRSRSSLIRDRSERRRGAVAMPTLPIAMSASRHDLLHLVVRPGDGILGRGARHRLREHVGEDERVGDHLHLVGGRRRPPKVQMITNSFILPNMLAK